MRGENTREVPSIVSSRIKVDVLFQDMGSSLCPMLLRTRRT